MNRWRELRPNGWGDPLLAAVFLVAGEVELIRLPGRAGPLLVEVLLVGALMLGLAVRRIKPLLFVGYEAVVLVLLALVIDLEPLNVPSMFLFVPPYTVARYEPARRAVLGLVICLAALVCVSALMSGGEAGWLFNLGALGASWATGRVIRAQRSLADALDAKADRISAERESRERLAVAEERTRIAHELHAVVADRVSEMAVRAGTAARLIDLDPLAADECMAAIEQDGHQVLADMRRVLGMLRQAEDPLELAPQPGIGQIPDLAELTGHLIALHVDGEPGPLPASVDLGAYRLVEDALSHLDELEATGAVVDVSVRFDDRDIELQLSVGGAVPVSWPTTVMREWAALCGGSLSLDVTASELRGAQCLRARLPRTFEELFA